MLGLELYKILFQSNISIYTRVCKTRKRLSPGVRTKDNWVTVETFGNAFFGGLSFNFKTSYLRQSSNYSQKSIRPPV